MKVEYTYGWFENNADDFDNWFNPNTFDWEYSDYLAEHCSKNFDKWWDAEKFNWKYAHVELLMFCTDKFIKWWDPAKFDWHNKFWLIEYCIKYINVWYDSSKFEESYDELLIRSIK